MMRKRTVNHIADTIFWYVLYFLPVIAYLLYLLGSSKVGAEVPELLSFSNFVQRFSNLALENPVADALYFIFGEDGIIPVFLDSEIWWFFTWFVYVYLVHLMVDFILFIPRYAHKWLKQFTQGD